MINLWFPYIKKNDQALVRTRHARSLFMRDRSVVYLLQPCGMWHCPGNPIPHLLDPFFFPCSDRQSECFQRPPQNYSRHIPRPNDANMHDVCQLVSSTSHVVTVSALFTLVLVHWSFIQWAIMQCPMAAMATLFFLSFPPYRKQGTVKLVMQKKLWPMFRKERLGQPVSSQAG